MCAHCGRSSQLVLNCLFLFSRSLPSRAFIFWPMAGTAAESGPTLGVSARAGLLNLKRRTLSISQSTRRTECPWSRGGEVGGGLCSAADCSQIGISFLKSFLFFLCGNNHKTCNLVVWHFITLQILRAPLDSPINHFCFCLAFTVFTSCLRRSVTV